MSQGDTVAAGAGEGREIHPRTWEFPDPRVAVLGLLIVVALLLQGRFGSLNVVGGSEGHASQPAELTSPR